MRCLDVIFKENATLAGDIEKAFNENEITQEVCELCAIRPVYVVLSEKQGCLHWFDRIQSFVAMIPVSRPFGTALC